MAETRNPELTPTDHRLPPARETVPVHPAALNGRERDPDAVREEIERTRERMSRTLDELEGRLVRGKEELWAKATLRGFRRKISTEPWRSVAIAFVAGYIVAAIRD